MDIRIRLADWRDHATVQPLRRQLPRLVDGGLWELLNWAMYHVHTAIVGDRVVGYTSVALLDNGMADDVGTFVEPEYRNQGVASRLRYTQLRDLAVMGWTHFYVAVVRDQTVAIDMCRALMGEPVTLAYPDEPLYFGGPVFTVAAKLKDMNVPLPHPLGPKHLDRLKVKGEKARQELIQLADMANFSMAKVMARGI